MKRVEELGISPMPWAVEKGEPVSVMSPLCIVCDTYFNKPDEYTMPNARLIAASPELYEALRSAVIQMCHDCPLCDYADGEYRCKENADKCFVNKWRNALAKASGEEAK